MKKIYSLLCVLLGSTALFAQNPQAFQKGGTVDFTPASRTEQHSADRGPAAPTVQYTNDVIIHSATGFDQRRVRISVAFNGWLYAAYSTVDSTMTQGGITILSSRNNGITWNVIDQYSPTNTRYPVLDIVVAGTDTNNLVLYVAAVNYNTVSGNYILFVDRYNATAGIFAGSNFNYSTGTRKIYDVGIASDYRSPAVGASPYSLGMIYSCYSATLDSVCFVGSVDGGGSWSVRQTVASTSYYNGKISIAYGRSNSASNGRYFAAWEQRGSSSARTGHIYAGHCVSTVNGAWNTPVCLDSVSSSMINLCCNPEMAVQYNMTDNDSGSCTAVVLCQRDYTGNGNDMDLLGFYNKRSHYTNYWNRLDIVNTGENDLQPDVTYDPGNNNFLAVYYDSTNGKLPYLVNEMNLVNPSTWTPITAQYNDVTTNLKGAWPRVEINPVVVQTAHAWIAEGANGYGIAMFDAEYNVTGVHNNELASVSNLYPNPAAGTVTLDYTVNKDAQATITVYNMLGETVDVRRPLNTGSGKYTEKFDVSGWANGVYTITISVDGQTSSVRMVVSHQ